MVDREGNAPAPEPPQRAETAEDEAWERLSRLGSGAYPDTARVHRALKRAVTVIGLALPIVIAVLTIATGQSTETVFYLTLGGLVIGVMLIKTMPG